MTFLTGTLLVDIVLLLLTILGITYLYFSYCYSYWIRRGVPYLKPIFPFGNVKKFVLKQECFGLVIQGIYNKFRDMNVPLGGFYAFGKPQLMVVDPDLIKIITTKEFQHFHDKDHFVDEENDPLSAHLLAQTGQKWRNLRAKLTPAFTSGKMKQMFDQFLICSELLTTVIGRCTDKKEVIDIKDFLARFTTDIIGSCAFGIECNSLTNPDAEFRKYGIKILDNTFRMFFVRLLYGTSKTLMKLLKIPQHSPDVTKFFSNLVGEIVEYREKNKVERKDIMNLLIQLKNNKNIDDGEKDDIIKSEFKADDKTGLTLPEVIAQAFIFFFGGFETSSSTMTFCLFELAYNQDIQEKVRQDIKKSLAKHDGQMTYDSLQEMHYLDKVIKETLRKYPVAPVVNRLCVKDFKVPNSNITIKKGNGLTLSILGLHRDPEYFPDPMKFDPERFTEEEKATRHPYTYIPFGEGPRICIGMRFGLLQTKLGIVSLIKNFKFQLDSKTKLPLEFDKSSVLLSFREPILLHSTRI